MEFIGPKADSSCPSATRSIKYSPRADRFHIARLLMLFLVNRILSKLIETNRNCSHVPCNEKCKGLLFSILTRRKLKSRITLNDKNLSTDTHTYTHKYSQTHTEENNREILECFIFYRHPGPITNLLSALWA